MLLSVDVVSPCGPVINRPAAEGLGLASAPLETLYRMKMWMSQ